MLKIFGNFDSNPRHFGQNSQKDEIIEETQSPSFRQSHHHPPPPPRPLGAAAKKDKLTGMISSLFAC